MQAIGVVTVTMVVLASILFGTDHLDRRLARRVHPRRSTHPATTPCDHAECSPHRVVHGRAAGPHGPLRIPHARCARTGHRRP